MDVFNNVVPVDFSTYESNHFFHTERYHREAIYNFEKKLSQEPKCVEVLCDWIASYHELASLYAQQGAIETAQKCLLIPHQSMLYMAKEHNGDLEQEQIAIRAISITLPPLLEFANEYPPCDNCMKELQAQLIMIQKNKKKDH
ncbi:hypothetical protein V6255_08490 [Psychromonas arctica]|uniref:Tetratricopeptide repeat protein n=1 Tax=Psychromonas arctica TaxID=168275 RepID=A0ABU9HBC3_9GAMM